MPYVIRVSSGVVAPQVVDVQGHQGVVDEALEELLEQVDIEAANGGTGVRHMHLQAWAAGEVSPNDFAELVMVERKASVERNTLETQVKCSINLDGSGSGPACVQGKAHRYRIGPCHCHRG